MLTYKEFRKKLLTELDQRGIKFEITSMTSVNGEKERISIAFSNFTTDNAVDSDHKPETFGLYPDHEYANYLGLCESESESPVERIVDDALQIMSQLSEKVSLEYVNSLLKLRDEDIIYQLINAKKYYLCRFQTLIQTICGQSQILMTATELQLFSILTKSRDLRMNWKMT